jgi:zinc transport system ATP-binding protein
VTALIQLTDVAYTYGGSTVLQHVTFDVEGGDFFGIIGPNGAGKTTLLKIMLGLLTPTRGEVRLFGVTPRKFREWRRLGYVPQKTTLDPTLPLTVGEVVASGLVSTLGALQPIGRAGQHRVMDALALVGMEPHTAARVGRLSVGQQQRVLIARALVSNPELLVLDEPTGGIDPEAQTSFYRLLHQLRAERRVTLVLVSHDIGVVAKEVTRLACLNGTVIFCGPPAGFLDEASLTNLYGAPVRVVHHHHDHRRHAS